MSTMDVPADEGGGQATRAAPAAQQAVSAPRMTWLTLALMTTSSVASLRAAPTTAVYGLACVFLYVVPAIVFLLPTAPADSGLHTAVVITVLYWTGVRVSSRGTGAVAGLASWGLVIGTLIPGTLLVVLGPVFLGQGDPSAAPMNAGHLFPAWTGLAGLVLIVNNFLSYPGMEMNQDQIAKTLGTDGGAVCEDPAGTLNNALWKVNPANGAAGPGQRPVVADARPVEAEAIVLNVYCPDRLEDFRDKLDDLDTAKTVNT